MFEVSMRWIGLRLDVTGGFIMFAAALIFVLSKGQISPAAAAVVLALCGRVSSNHFLVFLCSFNYNLFCDKTFQSNLTSLIVYLTNGFYVIYILARFILC